jgi:outer membrane protein assembly factor BamB
MPIFSASETMIYISSSVGIFYGLESSSGNILFSFEGDGSPFSAGAKSAPDDFLVYTTQVRKYYCALKSLLHFFLMVNFLVSP